MSEAAYVEIEWIGEPTPAVIDRATDALGRADSDAPTLTAQGCRRLWRKPVLALSYEEAIANFIGRYHPVRVRMAWGWDSGPAEVAKVPWQEMTIVVPEWARSAVAAGWSPPDDWYPPAPSSATVPR